MSCDVAVAAFLMFSSNSGGAAPARTIPAVAPAISVAQEPLFKDIVGRAARLKAEVERYRKQLGAAPTPLAVAVFDAFHTDMTTLSALDQQGHELLKARGTDGDLKCILHGISQDLPLKFAAIAAAKTSHEQDQALRDMAYLLNDNIEVITAPPAAPV